MFFKKVFFVSVGWLEELSYLRITENLKESLFCERGLRNQQGTEARLWLRQTIWRMLLRTTLGKVLGSSICQGKKTLTATLEMLLLQRKQMFVLGFELLSFPGSVFCSFCLKLLAKVAGVKQYSRFFLFLSVTVAVTDKVLTSTEL